MLGATQFFTLALPLLLLLLSPCSALVPGDDVNVEVALERLRAAVRQHDVDEVERILRGGSLRRLKTHQGPSPLFWVANEEVDSDDLARIAQLFLDHFGESNYDYDRYHPLTRAVYRGLTRVVDTLLDWPDTIREVHAKYLRCKDLNALPRSLRVVLTPDSPKCFQDFYRVVKVERSELAAAAARLHKQREQRRKKTGAADFDWSNPFLSPPPGKKPPKGHLVMNPQAFRDFSEAVVYYFLGEWSLVCTTAFTVIVVLFWCLTCGVFLSAARRRE